MRIRKVLTAIILAFVVFACSSESVPTGVIPKNKMVDVLYDFHLAQSFEQPHMGPKIDVDAVMSAFYKKHNITQEDLDSSLAWYSRHIDLLSDVYVQLEERYEKDAQNAGVRATVNSSYNVQGDTLDIWNQPRLRFLTSSKYNNRFDFKVVADTTFYMYDLFQLQFDLHFLNLPQEATSSAAMLNGVSVGMLVRYENDSISATQRTIYSPQHSSIMLKADSALQIKSVSGFFCMPARQATPVIIDGITLKKYHTETESAPEEMKDDEQVPELEGNDSLPAPRRLSPQEIRSSKPVERKVHIRKR